MDEGAHTMAGRPPHAGNILHNQNKAFGKLAVEGRNLKSAAHFSMLRRQTMIYGINNTCIKQSHVLFGENSVSKNVCIIWHFYFKKLFYNQTDSFRNFNFWHFFHQNFTEIQNVFLSAHLPS